jgi:3-phosphoshikimate 1-carboxyvinyltransferase
MNEIPIQPLTHPFHATITIPGSKSITNRALPLAALSQGETELTGVLFADDTWQMINALQTLGYPLQMDQKNRRIHISGRGPDIPPPPPGAALTLSCGNSGTTIRFLAAMLCLGSGEYALDGVPRMRQRPIDQLVDQLRNLGADITYEAATGFPPIRIRARGLTGGECLFQDAKSSQYVSAIMLAAPYAARPITLKVAGQVTSEPYIGMTLGMMMHWGYGEFAKTLWESSSEVSPSWVFYPGRYRPQKTYAIEPDASNASYFLAAAALVPGSRITIAGLGKNSLQGDIAFANVLAQMGAIVEWPPEGVTLSAPPNGLLKALDLDMNHIPDMVQTLAVVALFAQGTTTIRNVWNLRVKETDRLAALETELRNLGAAVETTQDSIRITPPPSGQLKPASIATYDDHRMAMAFALAALRAPGITIQNPQCTAKTYPDYFRDLQAAVDK